MDCEHERKELRYREGDNSYVMQCLSCGKTFGAIPHSELTDDQRVQALPVDDGIAERYWAAQRLARLTAVNSERQNGKTQWLQEHGEYLRSPEWQARRLAVLRRDGYLCQACLLNPAEQVHHLSYKHWQNEPLFELVSVCRQCHDKITEMDRAREEIQL